ncbi:MAG: right-handed parallel beta-helix repeat-containing protein [Acidobacteriota bacterium]|nr:right-handed parallel beta-helix repeat-containing protein [Acidobacteriota bacterium]
MPVFADDDGHEGEGNKDGKTLIVDDDKVQCPTATFIRIQDAVNAASNGDTIRVCAGTYKEQVTISKSLTINGDNGAIVMPSPVVANTSSLVSGMSIAAVILAMNAPGVNLSGLIVDGSANGIHACGPDLIGIYYRNASGTVQKNTVRNMKLGPGLEGCQSGQGIFVQSVLGKSKVTIDTNSVHDFLKNGITGNEPGTSLTVLRNVVTGLGPTTGAAQNGIQIGFGATGTVDSNIVANHVWSPCVSVNVCEFSATDILVFQSDGIEITRNIAGRSQGGVFVVGNNSNVHDNTVFDTLVFDGIGFQGNNNKASNNTVTKSDESGIFVFGNNNKVTGNTIQDAPIGVLKMTGSSGTVIQGNTYINVLIPTVDPPVAGGKASAYR